MLIIWLFTVPLYKDARKTRPDVIAIVRCMGENVASVSLHQIVIAHSSKSPFEYFSELLQALKF